MNSRTAARLTCAVAFVSACSTACARGELNILIWSDYLPNAQNVARFTQIEQIELHTAILDSDDTLQAKLLSGHSGYDVVYPSSTYFSQQIGAGVYQELDWSRIPNRGNLDAVLMKKIAEQDPGNRFGVPYVWGTDGMIINATRAREALGKDARFDSWDLILQPQLASKLHRCGISMIDSPSDVFPIVLAYLGRDPNSKNAPDYEDAYKLLLKVRPYIDQFSSTYLGDMAGGDVCIAMGWSGDVGVIRRRIRQAHKNFEIVYVAPKGQTGLWFTMMGIPKDAADKENAYKWINHMIDVEVAADVTNAITYPTAVPAARKQLSPELTSDPAIFPPPETTKDAFVFAPIEPALLHRITRLWLQFKAGRS
ncbi:MAG: extracellular solute-binding protein [Burkholderiaceae bacterium]|nr:extracellular solute-binding protein [Burkholderiaceae bacterium]